MDILYIVIRLEVNWFLYMFDSWYGEDQQNDIYTSHVEQDTLT
jgi:hypothetical protein